LSPVARFSAQKVERLDLELQKEGYKISANTVAGLLKQTAYSLQSVRKKLEGANHEDRDL
jgi:hypothetical protein